MSKRCIFTLSPGRCGTGYLAHILRTVPKVASFHEPEPRLHTVNQDAQFDPDLARTFWRDTKIPAIERMVIGNSVYVETSHLFVNAWGKVPAKLEQHIDLIALTRPHREVALSYWRRLSIPGRTKGGKSFLIHPEAPYNCLRLENHRRFDEYQLCYWHCLEVEQRIKNLLLIYDRLGSKIHVTTLKKLTTRDGFNQLVVDLALPEPDWKQWRKWHRRVINPNPPAYEKKHPRRNLAEMEQELKECLSV